MICIQVLISGPLLSVRAAQDLLLAVLEFSPDIASDPGRLAGLAPGDVIVT
jgi:hypothetical protein